ncbi:voltage-gated potassium channel [Aureococcus anophagefferens]|nr:voltage-gated potassium channel [Aureococcus anophagefferens]
MSALQPDDAPVQPDDAPVWREDERVVRTLALNQQKELADCLDLVAKIVENIAASPEEHKYRSLRAASKALSTRILARPGGRELLGHVGFKTTAEIEPKVELARRPGEAAFLGACAAWCRAFAATPLVRAAELKITLPSGATMRAAFRAGETGGPYVLATTRPPVKFDTDALLDQTLAAAGLAPRAALAATPLVDPAAADARTATEKAMDDARERGLRDRAVARATRDATEKKHRAAALARKQDAERQRTDALRGFGDDRAEQTERASAKRRAARLRAQRLADEEAALPAAEPARPRRRGAGGRRRRRRGAADAAAPRSRTASRRAALAYVAPIRCGRGHLRSSKFEAVKAAAICTFVMVSLIVLSVIVLILKETPPYNRNRPLNKAMNQMEVVFNIIFTTEIMLRLSIAETIWQAADLYIVFDILSVMPYWVGLCFKYKLVVNKRGLRFDRGSGNTKMVKKVKEMFKALRMLRLLKLTRRYDGSIVIVHALRDSSSALAAPFFFLFVAVVMCGTFLFVIEDGKPTERDDAEKKSQHFGGAWSTRSGSWSSPS